MCCLHPEPTLPIRSIELMRSLSLGILVLLLLSSCRAQLTPTPSSTPTAAPTAIPVQPTVTPALVPTATPGVTQSAIPLVAVSDQFTLTLPTGWQERVVAADQLRTTLTALQSNGDSGSNLAGQLATAVATQSTAVVAWLPDPASPTTSAASLIAVAVPRADLTLERYLAAAQAQLAAQPELTIASAQLEYSLRPDGIPVAVLQYTSAAANVDGYQVALLDESAEHLVLFTFTTPAGQLTSNLPDFQAIIRTLTWK